MVPPIVPATNEVISPTRPASWGVAPATVPADRDRLLLLVRLAERRFALPAEAILRILPMAAPTALPDAPAGIVGVVAFQSGVLSLVDPRPRLGLPAVAPHPDQHLIMIAAQSPYLFWVDRAETIVTAPARGSDDTLDAAANARTSQFVRVGDEYLPLLALSSFDPGSRIGAINARVE